MTTREGFITGLRQLADFLTVNPDVPTPRFPSPISVHFNQGNDRENFAAVDRAALAMGVEPGREDGSTHYEVELHFGPVTYRAVAIPRQDLADWSEVQRLGEEALARQKAEVAR